MQQLTMSDGERDDRTCQSYGYALGTPGYGQCRMQLDQQRRAAALAALGVLQGQRPYVLPPPPDIQNQNPPVNCTSTVNGQVVNTNCR
jgi:hypothetical protein